MSVKISGNLVKALTMRMTHGPSGISIETDPPVDNGGEGKSFSPTDLVAAAYGSCMMSIIALAVKRENVELSTMSIAVEKHMSSDLPRRIAKLKVDLILPGDLEPKIREKLISAALNCPVAKSINPEIEVEFSAHTSGI